MLLPAAAGSALCLAALAAAVHARRRAGGGGKPSRVFETPLVDAGGSEERTLFHSPSYNPSYNSPSK